jgi:hypothetical protein
MAYITHTVCAPLDHLLFAFGGKRDGKRKSKRINKNNSSLGLAEKRSASIVDIGLS